jgi:hypothetical protein
MNMLKWIAAGCIGGLIGALVWAGISYGTGYEIGWIAWAVGAVVGIAVRIGAGEDDEGWLPGIGSVAIAMGAILLGKYMAAHFLIAGAIAANPLPAITPNDMIVRMADDIVRERQAKGQRVVFAQGKTLDTAETEADYPRDIWQQATKKWNAISAEEQQQRIKDETVQRDELLAVFSSSMREEGFISSFGPFDILWFLLAAATAFRLGSGAVSEDE